MLTQKIDGFIAENNKLKRELAEIKTILVSHQNDSIRRMQERRRIKSIILKLKKSIFRYANMKSNVKMVLFYTGLSKPLFEWLLKYVPNKIVCKKLKLEDIC